MTEAPLKRPFNWWKLGFFIALVAFEFAREIAVLEANEPMGGQMLTMGNYAGLIHAEGQWVRSDGGSSIQPGTVAIDCFREWNTCIEASTVLSDTGIRWASTSLDLYEIEEISDSGLTYVGTASDCALYRVRIDLRQQRVVATRTAKEAATGLVCSALEKRVEMQLVDGVKHQFEDRRWRDNLNLPLLKLLWDIL